MGRIVGIRHRVKRTTEGESRPTLVAIKDGEKIEILELEDEQAELDFVFGKFPIAMRTAEDGEDLSFFPDHHKVERKKVGSDEKEIRVPAAYDGLRGSDSVVMILGGSGDSLAYAFARRGKEIGSEIGSRVLRIPGFQLAARRGEATKEVDHETLISIFEKEPELFYEFGPADRDNILVSELHRARREAQQARIGCEQRLRQALIGKIFLSEEGGYPEGTIAQAFDKLKANDAVFQPLKKEESKRTAELKLAVHKLPIWRKFLVDIEGCGEVLAAGIISPIVDIRMFRTKAKLKAFVGVHVLPDGRFARKRAGSTANWNPRARQALFLLGDQFNKRKDSEWGKKLREYKAKLRVKHPVVECSTCGVAWEECLKTPGKKHTKRYTDGHIHKMAIWRTLTKFVERFHKEWARIDSEEKREKKAA